MAVTLTEQAANHVKGMIEDQAGAVALRLGIAKSGCTGFAYAMDLATDIAETDQVFESHGVKVVVDSDSLPAVDGTQLDYVSDGLNRMFKFDNPNVKNECGCGESFSV